MSLDKLLFGARPILALCQRMRVHSMCDSTKHATNGFWPPCDWQLLMSICLNERDFSGHKAVNSTALQIFPSRHQKLPRMAWRFVYMTCSCMDNACFYSALRDTVTYVLQSCRAGGASGASKGGRKCIYSVWPEAAAAVASAARHFFELL